MSITQLPINRRQTTPEALLHELSICIEMQVEFMAAEALRSINFMAYRAYKSIGVTHSNSHMNANWRVLYDLEKAYEFWEYKYSLAVSRYTMLSSHLKNPTTSVFPIY
jgi:spore coat polysaccharide biosynthesis protein SpsF (cytidylyltransferase family)